MSDRYEPGSYDEQRTGTWGWYPAQRDPSLLGVWIYKPHDGGDPLDMPPPHTWPVFRCVMRDVGEGES